MAPCASQNHVQPFLRRIYPRSQNAALGCSFEGRSQESSFFLLAHVFMPSAAWFSLFRPLDIPVTMATYPREKPESSGRMTAWGWWSPSTVRAVCLPPGR